MGALGAQPMWRAQGQARPRAAVARGRTGGPPGPGYSPGPPCLKAQACKQRVARAIAPQTRRSAELCLHQTKPATIIPQSRYAAFAVAFPAFGQQQSVASIGPRL